MKIRTLASFVLAACFSASALAQAQNDAPQNEASTAAATQATQDAGASVDAKAAPDAGKGANAPLSIADLEKLFKGAALPDVDAAQSVGATMPLTPDQIRALRKYVDDIRAATAEPPKNPGAPEVSSAMISLEPGVKPQVLRLEEGISTTIVFQDATGAPWPVKSAITGNKEFWSVENEAGSNIVVISPLSTYAHSNLVVQLQGAPAPVIMTLKSGYHDKVHYRFDALVQGRGPNASTLSLDLGRGPVMTSEMISLQDGVPPEGAVRLRVSGAEDVQAWKLNGKLYLRTRLQLQTPEPARTGASPDGMRIYELDETPVVFLMRQGASVRVALGI